MKKTIRTHFAYGLIICFFVCVCCYQRLEIQGLHEQLTMQTERADLFKAAYKVKLKQNQKLQK